MVIAVTYENGNVFQHFGHTEFFKVYEVQDGNVVASDVVSSEGFGHGALAGFLADRKVDALICGGMGAGAQMALAEAGIKVYPGVSGNADAAIQALLAGTLKYAEGCTCHHHDHEHGEGHSCSCHCGH